uniref:Metalloendopeptidase n=1 Tax=Strongyloides stercoralis TaxID=6248 RepID=A0A0K0EFS4_STRER
MKSIIYIHISIITSFTLLVIFWTINTSLIFNQILVNYDRIFTYYHKNFKREILKDPYYPWNFPIKYYIESEAMKANVKIAISEIQNNTCIKFEEQSSFFNNTPGLIFKEGSSCLSFYGRQSHNYSQEIWLSPKCYINPYIILHEIGHALGLVHEHARMARDKYIKIDFGQLDNHGKENFRIRNQTYYLNYSTSYDYASVMHYGRYDFGSFWKWLFGIPVMRSKLYEQYTWMMGQHEKATFNDYKRINLAHCNCCGRVKINTGEKINNNDKDKTIKNNIDDCRNSGYPHYDNCSKCICPTGYSGDLCENIIKSDSQCNETKFIANETIRHILLNKKMNCYIEIKPNETFTNVNFSVLYVNAPPFKNGICVESSAFQIKYRRDRGATGLLLCGHDSRTLTVTSESKTILFFYEGIDNHSFVQFAFNAFNKTKK